MSLESPVKTDEVKKEENLSFADSLAKEFEAAMKPPATEEKKDDKGTGEQGTEVKAESVPETPAGSAPVGGQDNAPKEPEKEPVPTWAKDLKLEDEDTVEAVNFFDKREAAPWTRTPVHLMPAEKQEKFKQVQRLYDRDYEARRKAKEAPKKDMLETINDTLTRLQADPRKLRKLEEAKRAIFEEDDEPKNEKPSRVDEPVDDKLSEAVQSGDLRAVKEILDRSVSSAIEKAVPKLRKEVLELTSKEREEHTLREQVEATRVASARLKEREGARYAELLEPLNERGETTMSMVAGSLHSTGGVDPITGEQVLTGDPKTDVENVYRYILSRKQNTGRRIMRVVPNAAQPPTNSTGGKEPTLSDADMRPEVPWSAVALKVLKQ